MSRPRTLYDSTAERDACGIGFVADARGRPSRGDRRPRARGASSRPPPRRRRRRPPDGDGAGVLLPIPPSLLPGPWCGLAMVFLRDDGGPRVDRGGVRGRGARGRSDGGTCPSSRCARRRGADSSAPGSSSSSLRRPFGATDEEAERRAYRARKRAERTGGAYVCSLSFRTVTYKALCAADQLADFYPDLRDPALAVPFAVFHQRFSTNTRRPGSARSPSACSPTTARSTRSQGNVDLDAGARRRARRSDDACSHRCSTSRVRLGDARQRARAARPRRPRRAPRRWRCSFPQAWERNPELDDGRPRVLPLPRLPRRALGRPGGARVHRRPRRRRGARPERPSSAPRTPCAEDGLVVCSSEAGRGRLPVEGRRVRARQLGPGQMLAVDPRARVSRTNAADQAAARGAGVRTARWLRRHLVQLDAGDAGGCAGARSTARQVAAGYTREELTLVLRPSGRQRPRARLAPWATTPRSPPLAGRARPLFSYFRQRFAQVTNPPIDHLRERLVMSLRTLLGPRAPLLPRHPSGAARSSSRASSSSPPRSPASTPPARRDVSGGRSRSRRRASASRGGRGRGAERRRPAARDRRGARAGRPRFRPPRRRGGAPPRSSRAACARGPRSSSRATSRGSRITSPACSATGPTRSARGSRSRPLRPWPPQTRSAATTRRPTRRSGASGRRSRTASSRSWRRWASRTSPATAARRSSRRSGSPGGRRPLLSGDAVPDRRHRLRRARARGAGSASRRARDRAAAGEPRLRQASQGRRAARDEP